LRIDYIAALALTAAAGFCFGCAVHQPVSRNWRFVNQDSRQVLIPPGVAGAGVAQRTVRVTIPVDATRQRGVCPDNIRRKGRQAAVKVTQSSLVGGPKGWLTTWAAKAESQGCIPSGEASTLARIMAESLPLTPAAAFRVLYPDDLVPPVRLQVVSPILHHEGDAITSGPPAGVSGTANGLAVTLKADNLVGYETAIYEVRPKGEGTGFAIVPVSVERHVGETIERPSQPSIDFFRFPPDAAFYRLYVKSGETRFTALAIAASTREELARLAAVLDAGGSCDQLGASCIAIPRQVALNAMAPVTINNSETLVRWGANLGEALRSAGVREPQSVLAGLAVSRLYGGRPIPIEFDQTDAEILRLPLMGGEVISWR